MSGPATGAAWMPPWLRAWAALGVPAPPQVLEQLLRHYRQPHRHYHTLQHLGECLRLLEPALGLALHAGEVQLALWFHDAVYEPRARDNEARSADWAVSVLHRQGVAPEVSSRVHGLIMATCHAAVPREPDAQLLVDADLGILAAAPARFAQYQAQVRAEYQWVDAALYQVRRREVLQGFVARESIYASAYFRQRLEAEARRNLAQALAGGPGAQ